MHPHTPQDRRAFESPEFGAAEPPADRELMTDRSRVMARWTLIAALFVIAIVALIILL